MSQQRHANEREPVFVHALNRVQEAVSWARPEEEANPINQRISFGQNPITARRYRRLVVVLSPGTT